MNAIEKSIYTTPVPFRKRAPLPVPEGNIFTRRLTAQVVSKVCKIPLQEVVATLWPNDRLIQRAATAPAMTTVVGWAAELAQRRVYDALEALGPASAGAEIFRRSLVLSFDGAATIGVPGFVAEYGNAGFVSEGSPIPVRQMAVTGGQLQAHKLAAIAVLTQEMIRGSNAEVLISDTLMRAAGRMLDEVLFDANPADNTRPAGLRLGVTASTPSASSDPFTAVAEDVATLINAVAPVGGNGPYILVGAPGRAVGMAMRFVEEAANVIVLGSNAVINDLLVIAPAALVAALDPEPIVDTSTAATLHMETAPQPVGTAAPAKSMYQTEAVALKMRWPVSWCLRDPRGFAWMTPNWK